MNKKDTDALLLMRSGPDSYLLVAAALFCLGLYLAWGNS